MKGGAMGDEALRAWLGGILVEGGCDFALGLAAEVGEGVRMLPSEVSVLLSSLFGGLSVVLTLAALNRACSSDTVIRGLLLLLLLLFLLEPLTLPFFRREWPFCMSGMVVVDFFSLSTKGGRRGEENAGVWWTINK
jgi:hypothetical protein